MRRPWLLNLLLLAAIAAVGARLLGLWRSPLPALPEAPVAARADGAGEDRAPEPGAGGAPAEADFAVIVERDLFSPSRGAAPPAAPVAATPTPPPAPPKPPPKISLFGVVILDGEKSAFLGEGAGDVKPRKVREGEAFAGGTVRTIRPDGVTLSFPTGEVNVALRAPKEGLAPVPGQPVLPGQATQPGGVQPARVFPVRPAVATPVQRRVGTGAAIPSPGTGQAPRFTPPPGGEDDLYDEGLDEDEEDFGDEDEEYLDEDEDVGADEE